MSTEMVSGQSCELRQLSPDECLDRAVELMHKISPALELAHGEVDAPSAIRLCMEGKAYCFVGENNGTLLVLAILEFIQYPLKKVCNVLAYAGRTKEFIAGYPKLEDWARGQGATEIRGYGTPATCRLAGMRYGYTEFYRVYGKAL
jgi:hypothetical protein